MRRLGWALVLVLLSSGCSKVARQAAPAPEKLAEQVAPDFTLNGLDGASVSLSSLRGKVLLLDFWATWCPPCRASLPHTAELAQRPEAKRGELQVLAINSGEAREKVAAFVKTQRLNLPVLLDPDQSTTKKYQANGLPTFVVVGRRGTIVYAGAGFDPATTPRELDDALASALKQPATPSS